MTYHPLPISYTIIKKTMLKINIYLDNHCHTPKAIQTLQAVVSFFILFFHKIFNITVFIDFCYNI